MRILIRPGLVLVGGLLLIGGLLTLVNWRIAQRSALSRADYYEQRAQGVQQHAGSLEAQLEILLDERAALSNQVAELESLYQAERAANEPLREEVKTQLAARIGQQRQLETHQRQQVEQRDRARELETALAAALKTVGEHETLQAEHRAQGERVTKLESDLQAAVRDRDRLQKEQQEQHKAAEALRARLRDTEAALKARDATIAELRAATPDSGP